MHPRKLALTQLNRNQENVYNKEKTTQKNWPDKNITNI